MAQKFRHEYKFSLSQGDYMVLRSRLRAVMRPDPHAGASGGYHVRSVYFDTPGDKALREKINGVNYREKFRIRYYNLDSSVISLEKKSKENGLCSKISLPLTAEQADKIFHGDVSFLKDFEHGLAAEFYSKMENELLRPKIIVDYFREPFVFPAGNVRVTLDRDIRTGFFDPELLHREAVTLPTDSGILLEVKYDQFLPEVIRGAVQLGQRQAGAFSKYAVCRKYG